MEEEVGQPGDEEPSCCCLWLWEEVPASWPDSRPEAPLHAGLEAVSAVSGLQDGGGAGVCTQALFSLWAEPVQQPRSQLLISSLPPVVCMDLALPAPPTPDAPLTTMAHEWLHSKEAGHGALLPLLSPSRWVTSCAFLKISGTASSDLGATVTAYSWCLLSACRVPAWLLPRRARP